MKPLSSLPFYIIFCFIIFQACQTNHANNNPQEEVWIDIFDGNNMKDWTPKFAGFPIGENYKNRFVCKDQLLSVRYEAQDTFNGNFGHLFYKEKFSHYRIKADYRFVGDQMPHPTHCGRSGGHGVYSSDCWRWKYQRARFYLYKRWYADIGRLYFDSGGDTSDRFQVYFFIEPLWMYG